MSLKRRWAASFVLTALALTSLLVPLVLVGSAVKAAVLYDSGNPTPDEQLVLEYINRARANPVAEGQRLGIDIHEGLDDPSLVGPRPPLAMNKILLGIAQTHSQNMYTQNYFSHGDPNGATPFDRMIQAGYNYLLAGENMAAGDGLPATDLENLMMVDSFTPGRPHRVNLLSVFPYPCSYPPCVYSEVGVGYYDGGSPNVEGLSTLITEDFGATSATPFLLGVVYNDANHNNFYDIGEGIAGVTITTNGGSYYAITSTSGGYALPTGTSGTITVTASGPGFGPITKTVTLGGVNVKVDFTTTDQTTSITTSTSMQTSTTSTVLQTTSTQTTTSTGSPSIGLNLNSAPSGTTVALFGSGFSSMDTRCSFFGNAVGSSTCSIARGTLTGSFVVANVAAGSSVVSVMGSPVGDSASVIFTVLASVQTTSTSIVTSSTQSSTGSSTSTITTVNTSSTETSETNPAKTGDFSVASSSTSLLVDQGGSGSDTVTVFSINGFSSPVSLSYSWVGGEPTGVTVSVDSPITPYSSGAATSPITVNADSSASTGTFTVLLIGSSGSLMHTVAFTVIIQATQPVSVTSTASTTSTITHATSSETSSSTSAIPVPQLSSNCALSSATSGSELSPLAQELRAFRDQLVLKTRSGAAFMVLFNAWYYSFSPHLATYVNVHPNERALLRYSVYPLIAILYASRDSYLLLASASPEAGTVTAGIVAASLIGLVYLAPMGYIGRRLLRHYGKSWRLKTRHMILWSGISVAIVGLAYFADPQLIGVAAVNMVLSIFALGAMLGATILSDAQLVRAGVLAMAAHRGLIGANTLVKPRSFLRRRT